MSLTIIFSANFIDIKYEVQERGLLRTLENFENGVRPREKLIEEEAVSNAYSQDLANILKNRKSVLEEIYIDTYYHDSNTNISSHNNILYSVVLKAFESLDHPIRTKIIRMAVVDQKDVISILQFIDPNNWKLKVFI
ncbi:hypothetical protein GCK72_020466 [Caenorhabditis remanei]|uniref:DUF38 domain-containing protein n=1 Tax=Caenorhabditis remanei TaxID=31234 RepID=A0A6A5GHJ5_CAERE|nr:hypothetical protein GCK72_020466 [Caenorhabditis remanei]KAF1753909.1 hypothetical protein GCK72_020466 [Caenorhabditis remanei]